MQISPINFKYSSFQGKITKPMVEIIKKDNYSVRKDYDILKYLSSLKLTESEMFSKLKETGLSYCEAIDKAVYSASGYNGGFFTVKYNSNLEPYILKMYFMKSILYGDYLNNGGLSNYQSMISDIKRPDIIQKGLKLHSAELNSEITEEQANRAADYLSKLSHKYIRPKYLFFIGPEAFYYDSTEKIVYCINAVSNIPTQIKASYRFCKFNTDKNGNAIGYTDSALDIFQLKRIKTTYNEQQEVSEKLPPIADKANNKLYAEAFRFGNTKEYYSAKVKQAIPEVLNKLSKRININPTDKEQLQIVKLYDKDKNIVSRICYYDPTIGHSFVFDDNGKFIYEMEYNKDHWGNIIACS